MRVLSGERREAGLWRQAGVRRDLVGSLALDLAAVANGVDAAVLVREKRGRAAVVRARQLAMYLLNSTLSRGMAEIGRQFGRDRATVRHACQLIEDARDDPGFDRLVETLHVELRSFAEGVTDAAA
ncbi:MAG: chromosomal replication initiator DnaA [Devosia sp.]|nr:chromosomal replication initiator DnaA [Devosia sp.]